MSTVPYSLAWLPCLQAPPDAGLKTPVQTARFELDQGLKALGFGRAAQLDLDGDMGDAYQIAETDAGFSIRGGERGLLYGAYGLLMALAAHETPNTSLQKPFYALRMLDMWDNPAGDVERGYAGRSLLFEGGELRYDAGRIRQLGRMLASVGIETLCINNVNVSGAACRLIDDAYLPEAAKLADVLRPFGARLMLAVDFAAPMRCGLSTADPLDVGVQRWWCERARAVYAAIPDLTGFLVKADSEHRPGPFTYGRNHAEGANMLARALRPLGGTLVWRCFVYDCGQDWRDAATDRPMAAYEHYAGLDGCFDENVVLQIKHGPFDFQVREPVSPLLFAMPRTRKAMEVQLAQEYTGHQIDLYAMPPMWREVFDDLPPASLNAVAAVSNLGRDANWTGHDFAQFNLFAYGHMAWNPLCEPEALMRRWARLSYALKAGDEDRLVWILSVSRQAYEKYTAPLGICWMVNPMAHYGPNPGGYEFSPWGTYHRADREAIGIDRTAGGTGYVLQYPEALKRRYETPENCPDELLLFFHRLPYGFRMRDGRTLVQRVYDDHFEGVEMAERMAEALAALPLPPRVRQNAMGRMERQLHNAREWRDVINTFFRRMSGAEDERGRVIYP